MVDDDAEFLESRRVFVTKTLTQVSSILQSALREWLAETLARLLSEQPQVVTTLEPGRLSALKSDFERARDLAIADAENVFKGLDLDLAAREAAGYATSEPQLDFEARVDRLLDGPIEVLSRGGFTVRTQDVLKGELLDILGVSLTMALGSYGKHGPKLKAITADQSKAAWDRA